MLKLEKIVGGGQALGTLENGKKAFVWGGLPGETVEIQITKKKSSYVEAVVTEVLESAKTSPKALSERVEPRDPESYLSTSPWQIMSSEAEKRYKEQLIGEAFQLSGVKLPNQTEVYTDGNMYNYRNKVEFSFWFDTDTKKLSLAFYRRGTHGKIAVEGTSLAHPAINEQAQRVLRALNEAKIEGRALKTLLIRCNRAGEVAWQLYVKDIDFNTSSLQELLNGSRGEIIYSNPKSPASVITKRLTPPVAPLSDSILGINFNYATEGFFQINLPVYEQALEGMSAWVLPDKPVLDLYSGVGTIGLTIGGKDVTLVEVNESAVNEMKRNIKSLNSQHENRAVAVLAASESALDYITGDKLVIVDPPRAGLHEKVISSLLETSPQRIIYLSCNPVTQARDVALLATKYYIKTHQGYNFFPRTPHIEHLVVLDLKNSAV